MVHSDALCLKAGKKWKCSPAMAKPAGIPGASNEETAMTQSNQTTLGIRVNAHNPDHHLWNNNGTWFVHYTVYPTPVTAERVRRSLKTRDRETARQRRDDLFSRLNG